MGKSGWMKNVQQWAEEHEISALKLFTGNKSSFKQSFYIMLFAHVHTSAHFCEVAGIGYSNKSISW